MAVAYSTNSVTASSGQLSLTFIVKRSGTEADLQSTTSVSYQTANDTASAGSDYTATSGQLVFAPGVTEQSVTVAVLQSAYDNNSSAVDFLFSIPGYTTMRGVIDPASDGQTSQTYLSIPDTTTSATVPTTDLITGATTAPDYTNIKNQTDYNNLGNGDATSIDMPFAYIRLGYTGQDMNDYERVIVNSDAFQPKWLSKGSSAGKPREIGPLAKHMLPRGIDRADDPEKYKKSVKQLEANNANFDGIFLYSGQNYIETVGRHLNQVVKGDFVEFVGGHKSEVAMKGHSRWTYYGGTLRNATGLDKVNGTYWHYAITDANELRISTKKTVEYALDVSFSASAAARMIVDNNVKYTITNGIEANVQGLSAQINGDIFGYYGIKMAGSLELSNAFALLQVASQRLCFQVNPLMSQTAANLVKASSIPLSLAGMSATTPGWISKFQSEKQFFNDANSEELGSSYAETFTTALPATIGALATVNAAIVIAAASMQMASSLIPLSPTIELTPTALTLSVGPSSITVTNLGVTITAPRVGINASTIATINSKVALTANAGSVELIGGTSVALTSPTTRVTGVLQVAGNVMATGTILPRQLFS